MVHKRTVDARESTDKNFDHWKARFKVAAGAYEQGKLTEARSLLFRALTEAEGIADKDFAVPASNLGLAVVSMDQGHDKESKELFSKGLNSLASRSDNASRELHAAGLRFFARWHERQKDLTESERCLRESVETLKSLGQGSAVQLAYSLCDLSFVLILTDRVEEADALLKAAIEILIATVGKEDDSYDWAKMLYQTCHSRNDENLLIETFELAATSFQYKVGARHPNLIRAMNAYARALKQRGLTEQLNDAKERFSALLKT